MVQQLLPCRCWKEKSKRGGGQAGFLKSLPELLLWLWMAQHAHVNLFRWWLQPELPALITSAKCQCCPLRGGLISHLFLSSNGSLCSGSQPWKQLLIYLLPPTNYLIPGFYSFSFVFLTTLISPVSLISVFPSSLLFSDCCNSAISFGTKARLPRGMGSWIYTVTLPRLCRRVWGLIWLPRNAPSVPASPVAASL